MTAREFQESAFFDNVLVSSIRFLESFPAKTPNEKSQFLRGLPRVLDQFPKSVLDKKVLPVLLEETKDKDLLALILADVFKIVAVSLAPQRLYTDLILPRFREVFLTGTGGKGTSNTRDPAKEAGLAILVDNVHSIVENTSRKSFRDDVLPIVQMGLDSSTHAVVDKALSCLSKIIPILDFATIKNELFPVVATVFTKTSSMAIKIRGLQALALLCGGGLDQNGLDDSHKSSTTLDRYTVQEKVVPLLKGIKTKEPAVMMAALNVFRQIGGVVETNFLAMDVLPILWFFGLGPLLNLAQFQEYMEVIRGFSSKIEKEQSRKLQDLASTSANGVDAGSQPGDLMSTNDHTDLFSIPTATSTSDFERLVSGKASEAAPQPSIKMSNPFAAHPGTPSSLSPSLPWSSNAGSFVASQSSRAVTPALSAATLPSRPLQPSLQPTLQPSAASNPWASPPTSGNPSSGGSATANPWASPPMNQISGQSYSAWSRPANAPPSMNSQGMGSLNNMHGQSVASIQPSQSLGQSNNFVLAPPPGLGMPMNSLKNQVPSQPKQKTGLDAYESLI